MCIFDRSKKGMEYNMKEIRVLQVFGEPLSNGGQESFLMNMYRNMDKNKIIFDFFTPYYCDNESMKKELESTGSKVFIYNGRFLGEGNKKDLRKNVKEFFEKNYYDIVHIHSGSTYALMYISKMARKSGAKKVIVHSHCGGFKNFKYRIIKLISTPYLLKYPTDYYACSKLAAEWKFPKKIIKEEKYTILKNAVDTNKLYFDEHTRNETRKKLNIEDKFVIGHIGRFSLQKNHDFLIDIFNEIQKKKNNSVLMLIGTGDLQETIKEKIDKLGLSNKVLMLNLRKDIQELLNAMDVFVLPSFFEGLPVVGVEAQATGLQVFTSTGVTKELPIEELSYYYALEDGNEKWAEKIIKESNNFIRKNTTELIKASGYDVKIAAKKMEELYFDYFI